MIEYNYIGLLPCQNVYETCELYYFAPISGLYCSISIEMIAYCPLANYFHTVLTIVVLLTHLFQLRKNFLPLLLFLPH